jgi:hypothetical protein
MSALCSSRAPVRYSAARNGMSCADTIPRKDAAPYDAAGTTFFAAICMSFKSHMSVSGGNTPAVLRVLELRSSYDASADDAPIGRVEPSIWQALHVNDHCPGGQRKGKEHESASTESVHGGSGRSVSSGRSIPVREVLWQKVNVATRMAASANIGRSRAR